MEKQLLKQTGIIAVIITFSALAFWFGFAKISLGIDAGSWTPYAMKKNSVCAEQLIIMCGPTGAGIVFGTTSGAWVGTPTDSTLARIGLNTGTGRLEIKNAGTDTASPIVKYHDDLADVTANQHHNQTHGAADHTGNIGTESQITFGSETGHAHTGTDSTKVNYPNLVNRSHGAADHTGNIGTESQITFGSETGHAHTGTDSTKVSYPNLLNRSHGATDHTGNIGTESQITFGTASGHSHNGSDSTKIDYDTAPVELGTDTAGNSDNISEGGTNKYYLDSRVNAAVGSLSVNTLNDVNITFNENDFVKIVGGQLVAGSSTVTVAFSEVAGSATASQIPLMSSLLGSATASQLPTVLRLAATTTTQSAGAFGQLYVQSSSSGGGSGTETVLLLHMDNPGTSTFVDSSASPKTVTAVADAIGTTTAKFGSGGLRLDGTGDYLSMADSADWDYPGNMYRSYWIWPFAIAGTTIICIQEDGSGVTNSDVDNYTVFDSTTMAWNVTTAAGAFNITHSLSTSAFTHIEQSITSGTAYFFVDGVLKGTATTSMITGLTGAFEIGRGYNANSFNGIIDEFIEKKGIGGHTTTFTPPTAPDVVNYNQYSAKYADPVNGNTVLEILTPGAATSQASYIYNNATTTVFGLGTNTAILATSTAYSGWFAGAVRATAFNVASTEKIKDNIKPIKIKPDLLDAEGMAKNNYIAGAKSAWIAANQAIYTTVVNETGTGSVTIVDTDRMESDYNNHIELQWASDPNRDTYTKNVQKTYEKGFWQIFDSVKPRSWNPKDKPTLTRKGFVVEEMPDIVKGDDGQSIDPMALIAYISIVQQTLKADTIFALSTLKELITTGTVTQQKIDYVNDRLEVLNF